MKILMIISIFYLLSFSFANDIPSKYIEETLYKNNYSNRLKYDFTSDNSITRYVGKNISLENIKFEPDNLIKITNKDLNFIVTNNNCYLRSDLTGDLNDIGRLFRKEFSTDNKKVLLYLNSCYRSYNNQLILYRYTKDKNTVANPGHSEHQLGLAIDIKVRINGRISPLTKEHLNFLENKMHIFGFHQPYQNGKDIDGYAIEPWHWRYVGVDIANYLYNQGITYSQFYKNTTE